MKETKTSPPINLDNVANKSNMEKITEQMANLALKVSVMSDKTDSRRSSLNKNTGNNRLRTNNIGVGNHSSDLIQSWELVPY